MGSPSLEACSRVRSCASVPRCRRPLVLAFLVAVVAFSLVASGCGGGGSRRGPRVAVSTTAAPQTTPGGRSASTSGSAPVTATSDCDSLTTCYTPRELEAAYGILPLLEHGTDGRGETIVLPELAEPQFPLP